MADWQTAAKNQSVLFEKPGTNRSLVFQARKGDADAAFANAPYTRREYFRTGRHYGLTMEPRGVMATWDDAKAKLTMTDKDGMIETTYKVADDAKIICEDKECKLKYSTSQF